MILSGTLLTPTGLPFKSSYVRLVAKSTSDQVLKGVTSGFTTDAEGVYSVDCPLGNYSVVLIANSGAQTIGSISIDAGTTETSINALIILGDTAASNPLVQEIRQLAVDVETAAIAAGAAETAATAAVGDAQTEAAAAELAKVSAELAATAAEAAAAQSSQYNISTWALTQAFQVITATRDGNGAIVSANIKWPDGVLGVFTTDAASITFPGAIDAWHATYLATVAKLITQPAVTRDSNGAVIAQPAITIV